jgi:hypothetical protein
MRKWALKDFVDGIEAALRHPDVKTATVFCEPLSDVKQRVRVTRRQKGELVVTFGRPNYAEREFLKLCRRAKCNPRRLWMKWGKGKGK